MMRLKAVIQNFVEVNKSLLWHPDSFRPAFCKGLNKEVLRVHWKMLNIQTIYSSVLTAFFWKQTASLRHL